MQVEIMTISARGVILTGESFVDIKMSPPECPPGTELLIFGIHVGPEVEIGSTSIDVIHLPTWAVSVPLYQLSTSGAVKVAFTALAQGAQHISASLPAGQTNRPVSGIPLSVRIALLGGVKASHRFEFNVHLTCSRRFY